MGKSYYSGVLLPDIPAELLAEYPYHWIRMSSNKTTYNLVSSPYAWYLHDEGNLFTSSSTYVWYTADCDADAWTYKTSYTDTGNFNLSGGLVWSNHNIPNGSPTATVVYFYGSNPVPLPSFGDDGWVIQEETLVQFADQARRISGSENELSTAEMLETFGSAEVVKNQDITIKVPGVYTADSGYTGFGTVTVEPGKDGIPLASTAEFGRGAAYDIAPDGKSWFNGVLLPEIPVEVLGENPYVLIRKNTTSGYYDLFFSTEPFYTVDADTISGSGITKPWYRVAIATAENAVTWESNGTSTGNLGYDASRPVLWSNHDIPNGSATATDIYFQGTEPVKEMLTGYGDYATDSASYAVTSNTLNELAHLMQKRYSTYDLFTGEEIRDFVNRCDFYEKGKAASTWDLLVLSAESSAVGVLTE